ncbi:MAG: hypothetical protein MUC36_01720 [Planctomycetes bacterium]|nr:hypothetical protein [Planctomycetota bacterium]
MQSLPIHGSELRRLVALQQKAYALLRWLAEQVDAGNVVPDGVHSDDPDPAAVASTAHAWLQANLPRVPWQLRPRNDESEVVGHLFASLLVTSHEVAEQRALRASPSGCRCPMCLRLVPGSHLIPRRTDRRDERRARALQFDHVARLAAGLGVDLTEAAIDELLDDRALQPALAMATWAEQLVLRSRGEDEGTPVLVLWRRFAWTRNGSPEPTFVLDADLLLQAEHHLAARLSPTALRVFAIDAAVELGVDGKPLTFVSAPGGSDRFAAFGLRHGSAVQVERPDGTCLSTTLVGMDMGGGPERRQSVMFGSEVRRSEVPVGSWLRVPRPPAPRRAGDTD